jgi:S1-C subfamily serine protease
MRKAGIPLLSGLLGGVVVAAVLLATGVGGGSTKSTTVVQQAPLAASAAADTGRFTAREIYKRDAPGVAFIRAQVVQQTQSPFDLFPQQQRGEATGSGFVIDKAGDILTNAHVIDGAVKVTVQLSNDKTVDAKVVGKDSSTDLALLKVDPDGLDLHPLTLGSAKDVQVGDPVLAIGNPFGLDRTLTTGVVSALQRQIKAPNGFAIDNVIQTDAAINPGNSGGPLLDAAGRVIGINSQIETGGGGNGNIGIGFAVPVDTAEQVLPQLKKGASIQRAYMGITTRTVDGSLKGLNLPVSSGALVQSVEKGSPADKAGLRAGSISAQLDDGEPVELGGDIISGLDDKPVKTADDLASLVAAHKPGDQVEVHILRDGKAHTLTVTLGSRPNTVPGSQSQG